MQKQYTFTQKGLVVGLFLTLGIGLNDSAQAEYFDDYNHPSGQWKNQQYPSVWSSHSHQGEGNFSGKSSGEGQASGNADAEIEFTINLKAKVRTNAEMQQQNQFKGFMSQMRSMSNLMFQHRNVSNTMQHHYNSQNYSAPAPTYLQPVAPHLGYYQHY